MSDSFNDKYNHVDVRDFSWFVGNLVTSILVVALLPIYLVCGEITGAIVYAFLFAHFGVKQIKWAWTEPSEE